MKPLSIALLLVGFAMGCGGAGQLEQGLSDQATGGSCRRPAGVVAATDASAQGCFARSAFEICEVAPDGSQACRDACSSSQYSLACDDANPAATWSCDVLAIPTPAGVSIYCCPCQ